MLVLQGEHLNSGVLPTDYTIVIGTSFNQCPYPTVTETTLTCALRGELVPPVDPATAPEFMGDRLPHVEVPVRYI